MAHARTNGLRATVAHRTQFIAVMLEKLNRTAAVTCVKITVTPPT
jgi:hypothetical protein